MSIAQFIQYNQVAFLNDFWSTLRPESQVFQSTIKLFYDRGNEIFIFRELNQIFVINKNTLNKVTRIKIPYNGLILCMSISHDYQFVAYQTNTNQLVFNICYQNLFSTRANRQFFYQVQSEKNSEIIQFEWARGCQGLFDILVVETNGIHLLKIDDQVKKIKFFQQKISCCWYEPKNEVLTTCSNQNNGLISAYFFKEKKKDLKFKGPDFYLDDFEPKEGSTFASFFKQKKNDQQLFVAPTDKKNKDLCVDEAVSESIYRIYLIHIYGKSLLAYSNSYSGKIIFYLLQNEKINKQKYSLAFPSDIIINLSVVDNLILLSALNEKISIVFDVKKQRSDSPLGPPQSILQQREISIIRVKEIEKKPAEATKQVTTDSAKKLSNRSLEETQDQEGDVEEMQKVEPMKVESDQESNDRIKDVVITNNQEHQEFIQKNETDDKPNYFHQEQQIEKKEEKPQYSDLYFVYDVMQLCSEIKAADSYFETFLVKMKWSTLINNHNQLLDEQNESSCNYQEDDLIINYKEKQIYQFCLHLKYLPKTFDDEVEAFNGLLRRNLCKPAVYEFLIELALSNRPIMIFSNIFKLTLEILVRALQERQANKEIEKLSNGYIVLYPPDIQQNFFQALSENQQMNKLFLVELIIEFIRQFNEIMKEYRLQIPSGIQNLLIKLLIKENRFTNLHFLVQYHVLTDNVDFARLLIDISSKESLAAKNLQQKYQPYEPAFQLGVDMYFRLQKYEDLLEILLKNGKFHDAAFLLRKVPNIRMRLPPIQEGIRHSDCLREDLLAFLEDSYKKQRTQFSVAEIKTL